jgi:hypothetical protein
MALNIRLSPSVDLLARDYCDRVGISLNSLVGVALDAYLRQSEPVTPAPAVAASAPAAPPPEPSVRANLEAVQRRKLLLTAEPLPQPVALSDPKPVLGPKSSKAERSNLAAWHRRNR